LAVVDLWQQLGAGGAHSPGANDNASGAAVLLAAAGHLVGRDGTDTRVGFLFTGAEEAGLYGADAYARRLTANGFAPRVVNVDMIGAGERLRLIERTGVFRPRRTDPGLNTLLERADPEIARLVYRRRDGDFSAFLRRGIPATGIEGQGTPRFWQAYHTLADTPERIDRAMLGRTAVALVLLAGRFSTRS
jgi:Zn-dependent M28 family amino/carboxypeptidase